MILSRLVYLMSFLLIGMFALSTIACKTNNEEPPPSEDEEAGNLEEDNSNIEQIAALNEQIASVRVLDVSEQEQAIIDQYLEAYRGINEILAGISTSDDISDEVIAQLDTFGSNLNELNETIISLQSEQDTVGSASVIAMSLRKAHDYKEYLDLITQLDQEAMDIVNEHIPEN